MVKSQAGKQAITYRDWKGGLADCVKECTFQQPGCQGIVFSKKDKVCTISTQLEITDDTTLIKGWVAKNYVAYSVKNSIVPYYNQKVLHLCGQVHLQEPQARMRLV